VRINYRSNDTFQENKIRHRSTYKACKRVWQGPIQIKEIAEEEKIPQNFLENILLELRKLGILGSKLGKSGGYYLLKKPEEVNLAEIVRHFEGTIALMYCVSEKAYQPCEFCKDESTCGIRKVLKK